MFPLSDRIRKDIETKVRGAFAISNIINVDDIASDVQRHNWHENVALEDLKALAVQVATLLGAVVAFGPERGMNGHANLLAPGQDNPILHPASAVADKQG